MNERWKKRILKNISQSAPNARKAKRKKNYFKNKNKKPPAPIETMHSGVIFRSRLEARWAYWFDLMGVKWQYEMEGFKTEAGWYLPDFYLPESAWFVEVKGPEEDGNLEKAKALHKNPPGYAKGVTILQGSMQHMPEDKKWNDTLYLVTRIFTHINSQKVEQINEAIDKARSYRFERSEK